MIGASPLLSALFHDEPTIEAINAIGLDFNAVGNHEFDEGVAELLRMQDGGCHPVDGCLDDDDFTRRRVPLPRRQRQWQEERQAGVPGLQDQGLRRRQGRLHRHDARGHAAIVSPSGISQPATSSDEADTVNALIPRAASSAASRRSSCWCTRAARQTGVPVADINGCTGISGPIVDIVNRIDAAVDVVISGHTHQPYNCNDRRQAGHERVLVRPPGDQDRPDASIARTRDVVRQGRRQPHRHARRAAGSGADRPDRASTTRSRRRSPTASSAAITADITRTQQRGRRVGARRRDRRRAAGCDRKPRLRRGSRRVHESGWHPRRPHVRRQSPPARATATSPTARPSPCSRSATRW